MLTFFSSQTRLPVFCLMLSEDHLFGGCVQRRPIFMLHREKIFQSNFRMVEINPIKTGDVQFNALSMYFINYINQQDKRRNQTLSWCVSVNYTRLYK